MRGSLPWILETKIFHRTVWNGDSGDVISRHHGVEKRVHVRLRIIVIVDEETVMAVMNVTATRELLKL